MSSNKAELLQRLAEFHRPENKRTWFPTVVEEKRREEGLSLEVMSDDDELSDELKSLQESYPPITVIIRHLYEHEQEIAEEKSRAVMRAVLAKYRGASDEEAAASVDGLVGDIALVKQARPEELPGEQDAATLGNMRGMWEALLGFNAMKHWDSEKELYVETALLAQGKHEAQVTVTDLDVELTEDEEAALLPGDEQDLEEMERLDLERERIYSEHKEKIRRELLNECAEAKEELEALRLFELKVLVGKNLGVQKALQASNEERLLWRMYYVIRDPDRTVKERVGHGTVSSPARFFAKVSRHPDLDGSAVSDEAPPDYTDVRVVSEDPGLQDFWKFLIKLDDEMTLCKTQEEVEELSRTRPFRGAVRDAGELGDRPLRDLADNMFAGGRVKGTGGSSSSDGSETDDSTGEIRQHTGAQPANETQPEGDESLEAVL